MFKNAQQARKSRLFPAAGEQKPYSRKRFKHSTTWGSLDNSFKSPIRNIKRSSRLFLFTSKGNVSNTVSADVSVADLYIYIPTYCLYTLGPCLSCYIFHFFYNCRSFSSCYWPHKRLPVICQSSLDEDSILKGHSADLLVMRRVTVTCKYSCIMSSVTLKGAFKESFCYYQF